MTEHDNDDNIVRIDFGRKEETPESVIEPAEDDPFAEEKLALFTRLIEPGMVMVTLNTRVPGVSVPAQHAGTPQLHLNFSHRFYIDDFAFDEAGVRASLSFQGTPHFCVVPWSAVYMMRSQADDTIIVFPESFPEPLQNMIPDYEEVVEEARAARRAVLEAEPAEATPEAEGADGPDDDGGGGSHLRLVK